MIPTAELNEPLSDEEINHDLAIINDNEIIEQVRNELNSSEPEEDYDPSRRAIKTKAWRESFDKWSAKNYRVFHEMIWTATNRRKRKSSQLMLSNIIILFFSILTFNKLIKTNNKNIPTKILNLLFFYWSIKKNHLSGKVANPEWIWKEEFCLYRIMDFLQYLVKKYISK